MMNASTFTTLIVWAPTLSRRMSHAYDLMISKMIASLSIWVLSLSLRYLVYPGF